MKETQFIKENKEKWQRFEQLNASSHANPEELSDLYLDITDDLGYAQTHYHRRTVRVYLNQLAQKVFIGVNKFKKDSVKELLRGLTISLPLEIYRSRKTLVTAFIAFIVYAAIGIVSTIINPDFPRTVMGDGYVDMTIQNIEAGNPLGVYEDNDQLAMFIKITTNNLGVAFLTFFAGFFFTIGTHILLFSNGVMLGAFQYYFRLKGLLITSFLGIWIHGAFEISAIVLAGGAGITAGNGWLFPGTHSRFQSMKLSTKRGVKIMFGLVPFIIAAGFLESYVTHNYDTMPDWTKWMIIVFSFALILFFFVVYPFYVAKKHPDLINREDDFNIVNDYQFIQGKIRSIGEIIRESLAFYQKYFSEFMSLIWKIALPVGLGLIFLRDYLFPEDQNYVYFFDWASQLDFIFGFGFRTKYDFLSFSCWLVLLTLIHSSVLHVFYNLTETPVSLIQYLKKRFVGLFLSNLLLSAIVFLLPWYLLLPAILIIPFLQLILPSTGLGREKLLSNIKIGFKFSASNYMISLITLILLLALLAVFLQPIAFVGSIVENEMRGPTMFPDVLDLLCDFIEKIVANYGQNGIFWSNVFRQIIYLICLLLAIPLYSILSIFLFSNMQEAKLAKSLWREYEKFGNRDRYKETSLED